MKILGHKTRWMFERYNIKNEDAAARPRSRWRKPGEAYWGNVGQIERWWCR